MLYIVSSGHKSHKIKRERERESGLGQQLWLAPLCAMHSFSLSMKYSEIWLQSLCLVNVDRYIVFCIHLGVDRCQLLIS